MKFKISACIAVSAIMSPYNKWIHSGPGRVQSVSWDNSCAVLAGYCSLGGQYFWVMLGKSPSIYR